MCFFFFFGYLKLFLFWFWIYIAFWLTKHVWFFNWSTHCGKVGILGFLGNCLHKSWIEEKIEEQSGRGSGDGFSVVLRCGIKSLCNYALTNFETKYCNLSMLKYSYFLSTRNLGKLFSLCCSIVFMYLSCISMMQVCLTCIFFPLKFLKEFLNFIYLLVYTWSHILVDYAQEHRKWKNTTISSGFHSWHGRVICKMIFSFSPFSIA